MSKEVKQALQIAIDYMNDRLEDHDCKYQRHPATEAERINILADIETVKEALAKQEQGEPTRHELQAKGEHPAPCARFCEANAFRIAERGYQRQICELSKKFEQLKQEQGKPQPALYVKDIDGNFHPYKEKGHTENCAALGDDCPDHLPPSRVEVGDSDSTSKQEQVEPVAVKVDDATTGTQYVKFLVDECLIPIGAKFYTTPQPVAEPHNGEPVAGPSGDFLSDFKNGQWWLAELDSAVANGTPDQKRAVSVVRNLLATLAANTTPQKRKPLTDEQIDEIIDSPADVRALITDARGKLRLFARAIEAAHGIQSSTDVKE